MPDHSYFANLIWQIADLLRGPYRPPQYERVMLPMTVLRRFDCVLAPTKERVLKEHAKLQGGKVAGDALDRRLAQVADQRFHNHSPLDFAKLKGDPDHLDKHLVSYIKGFSANVRRIFDFFEFENEIERMQEANILFLVVSKFEEVDLHPSAVPNAEMGLIFENLIRRFNELANETAGDHFTPREVIRLMVNLLFLHDDKLLSTPGTVRKLLDPACGTGGMLAEAQNYLREHHSAARLYVFGQDYNKRAFATAASDMLMKQVDHNGAGDSVRYGDSFTDDQFAEDTFDYLLANPPFGVDWKKQQKAVQRERDQKGYDGRFGAGLPRINDGSLLFLQHMISKFEPVLPAEQKHGSRLAIVFSGSPLFTGGAGSGESDIRKWIIENDWLEAVVALPEQMFYNTGIGTYVWVVTNRKEKRRKGKIQLVDAREFYVPLRRSQGDKRRKIGEKEDGLDQIAEIVRLYGRFADGELSKIFDNADFGFTRVTVERPLRLRYQMTTKDKSRFLDACPHLLDDVQAIDKTLGREPRRDWSAFWPQIEALLRKRKSRWATPEQKLFRSVFTQKDPEAEPVAKGSREEGYEPDAELRDFENVPIKEDVEDYFEREVLPHLPDAWMDRSKDKDGYEINFNRHFYKYTPLRPLTEVDTELKAAEAEIGRLLREAEKQQTLIFHAVTRGLDPKARFRDSGTPWLGEIPAHWGIWKIGHLAMVGNGSTPNRDKAEYWTDGRIPWLNSSVVNQDEVTSADQFITETAFRECHLPLVKPGSVLVGLTGQGKTRGQAVVLTFEATINQHLAFITPNSAIVDSWFLRWVFFAAYDFLRSISDGAGGTKGALTCEEVSAFRIPVPQLREQRAIVAHIARVNSDIETLRVATERTITLLKERRAALIGAAVTGQIKVDGVAA